MGEEQGYIQCVCGRIIKDPSEYKLVFLKKEQREIDILCPNDTCYLRELGFVQFIFEGDKHKIIKATFYSPFVTWNTARLGKEKALKLLKEQLKTIVKERIDWNKMREEVRKQEERERALREAVASEATASEESGEEESSESQG